MSQDSHTRWHILSPACYLRDGRTVLQNFCALKFISAYWLCAKFWGNSIWYCTGILHRRSERKTLWYVPMNQFKISNENWPIEIFVQAQAVQVLESGKISESVLLLLNTVSIFSLEFWTLSRGFRPQHSYWLWTADFGLWIIYHHLSLSLIKSR